MIDGKNFFDRLAKNDIKTYYDIWKIESGQEAIAHVHYTTGCFLDYLYFRNYYKMMLSDYKMML